MHIHIITFIMLLKHFESQETRVKITTAKVLRIYIKSVSHRAWHRVIGLCMSSGSRRPFLRL